ncbi:hypothetical protein K474DRAFT_1085017 [Panus rudis PR-1116 ss-1]|nr:hypothetical protein K474DRAFT_1085017 [Panus rudis PR-1116 ss-1]
MAYKRLRFFLSADAASQQLRQSDLQIIFTLRPTEYDENYEEFKVFHPVVWNIFQPNSDQFQEFPCSTNLAVCTAEKDCHGCILAHLSRIVPEGHCTALVKVSDVSLWSPVARWKEDEPTKIVAYNHTGVPQSFAMSTFVVNKNGWDPSFLPIVLFNKLKYATCSHILLCR